MHSSQNGQDNRTFAKFARVPCLEPSDSHDAKDMVIAAFALSERFDTPILLRLTTRICHSMSAVQLSERVERKANHKLFPRNPGKYVMVPANAIRHHPVIEQRMKDIALLRRDSCSIASKWGAGNWASSPVGSLTSTPGKSFQMPLCSSLA